jgi:hypothetical protein
MQTNEDFKHVEKHAVRRKVLTLAHSLPGMLWYEYLLAFLASVPLALLLLLTLRTMAWIAALVAVASAVGLIQLRRFWDGRREYVVLLLRQAQGAQACRILDRDTEHKPFGGWRR